MVCTSVRSPKRFFAEITPGNHVNRFAKSNATDVFLMTGVLALTVSLSFADDTPAFFKPMAFKVQIAPGDRLVYDISIEQVITTAANAAPDTAIQQVRADTEDMHRSLARYRVVLGGLTPTARSQPIVFQLERATLAIDRPHSNVRFDTAVPPSKSTPETQELTLLRQLVAIQWKVVGLGTQHPEITVVGKPTTRQTSTTPSAEEAHRAQVSSLLETLVGWLPQQPIVGGQAWAKSDVLPLPFATIKRRTVFSIVDRQNSLLGIGGEIHVGEANPNASRADNDLILAVTANKPGTIALVFDGTQQRLEQAESTIELTLTATSKTPLTVPNKQSLSSVFQLSAKSQVKRVVTAAQ